MTSTRKKAPKRRPRKRTDGDRRRRAIELFDPVGIRLDLAKLVGRLAAGARRAAPPFGVADDVAVDPELYARAGQVLDAVRLCLGGPTLPDGERASRKDVLSALASAEASIRQKLGANRPRPPRVPQPGEDGVPAIAEAVEADLTARLREDPTTSDADLVAQALVSRAMHSAWALLGSAPHEEVLEPWTKVIRLVRDEQRDWEPEELAHKIVLALARENGVQRPSRLFTRRAQR